jgi:hypothetical protein
MTVDGGSLAMDGWRLLRQMLDDMAEMAAVATAASDPALARQPRAARRLDTGATVRDHTHGGLWPAAPGHLLLLRFLGGPEFASALPVQRRGSAGPGHVAYLRGISRTVASRSDRPVEGDGLKRVVS